MQVLPSVIFNFSALGGIFSNAPFKGAILMLRHYNLWNWQWGRARPCASHCSVPAAVILHSIAIKPRFQKINVENMPSKHICSKNYILILIKEETARRLRNPSRSKLNEKCRPIKQSYKNSPQLGKKKVSRFDLWRRHFQHSLFNIKAIHRRGCGWLFV